MNCVNKEEEEKAFFWAGEGICVYDQFSTMVRGEQLHPTNIDSVNLVMGCSKIFFLLIQCIPDNGKTVKQEFWIKGKVSRKRIFYVVNHFG